MNWPGTLGLALGIVAGLVMFESLATFLHPLLLITAAVVLASAAAPIVDELERFAPRVLATLVLYLALLALLFALGWLVIPPLTEQAATLAEQAPQLLDRLERFASRWDIAVERAQVIDWVQQNLTTFGTTLASLPVTIVASSLDVFLVFAMSAYLVVTGPALVEFALSLVPPSRRKEARDVMAEMGQNMGGYIRGTVIDGAIVAAIVYVALLVLGVDFPLVLALLSFFGEFIPVLGPWLAGAPAVAVALTDSVTTGVIVLGFYFALQQFESYLLLPSIMRSQAHVPPLLTLVALLMGGAVAGIFGALLAIPVGAALLVATQRVLAPAIRSRFDSEETDEEQTQPAE